MPLPPAIGQFNKRVTNRVLVHLVGHGPFAEIEHVGRRSGRTYRTVIMAFRQRPPAQAPTAPDDGDLGTVTMALTYGPHVDWLRNARAAGHARLRMGGRILTLGPPRDLTAQEGLARMPVGPRQVLPLSGTDDFVEFPVVAQEPTLAARRP